MRKLLWILIILFFPIFSKAAYHTSGYISVKYLSGYTYQVTIVDYTVGNIIDTGACGTNDADTIRIYWGDGQSTLLTRSNGKGDSVCECRKANLYIGTHTYTGYGNYTIWYGAASRIPNIQNMINSGNQQIMITHTLIISPLTGNTNSPVIANPPICTYGCTS
ncbi:MAG TPA: hypothetical protein VK808_02010, partial [Bacteroidia bacterium]|nr:hypothetical protein [Bacteroidia bacterium]